MTTIDIQRDVAQRFQKDIAEHTLTVLHDDGLYRHLRFRNPKSSFYWFDIVTWPGSLAVRGDCGGFVFSRVDDMFEFFRRNGNEHGINPGYWAEKMPDGGRSVHEYSEDKLRAKVAAALAEYEPEYPGLADSYATAKTNYDALSWDRRWPYGNTREPREPKTPDEVRQIIADHDEDGLLSYETGARELLGQLEIDGVVSDTFEWDLTDWNWQYLWCCHAIAWAVTQYDLSTGRAARVETVELTGVSS